MITLAVTACQDVEQKRFHVVVKRFVVEEKLRQEAEVLAVDFVRVAVNFEDGDFTTAVDFSARWVAPCALVEVTVKDELTLGVLQAELAEKKLGKSEINRKKLGNLIKMKRNFETDSKTSRKLLKNSQKF